MYKNRIQHLEELHKVLDKKISGLEKTGRFDDLELQKLKRQKLTLRDQIEELKHKHEHGKTNILP